MVCDLVEAVEKAKKETVLILILLEYGLRPASNSLGACCKLVLILILLEYGLRPPTNNSTILMPGCLNPYSIGIWSATIHWCNVRQNEDVLILILLEYGLRQGGGESSRQDVPGLNPYSIGIWSATSSLQE